MLGSRTNIMKMASIVDSMWPSCSRRTLVSVSGDWSGNIAIRVARASSKLIMGGTIKKYTKRERRGDSCLLERENRQGGTINNKKKKKKENKRKALPNSETVGHSGDAQS